MLRFLSGYEAFALAGAVAATGPVIIHLLNRRRFRVVNWAAMDFLLEALQRNRRMLHLRDLLLLALRTACLLLFGLALARPYFSSVEGTGKPTDPVHAVLIVDNSLSMGYEKLDGNLLDEAKAKAREFIDALPEGSRISVLPLCGSAGGISHDAYRTKEDARDALAKIEVVDRAGTAAQAADLAREAMKLVPDLEAKRVVFLGDQQVVNWPAESLAALLKDLPPMQVVAIAPEEPENTWVDSFTVQDGIADLETQAVFQAVISHQGRSPRGNVQVTLSIDGVEVATQTIDLEPDQSREVTFPYRFDNQADTQPEGGRPLYAAATVSIPPDHLPQDDSRSLIVPVVSELPVVFIDQYGSTEDPKKNHYGETRHLRQLLAPITNRDSRQLVKIRQLRIEEVDAAALEDARLVVIAGVASPEGAVGVLREFVKQGGQLLIAAGAEFDPAAWNQSAWLDGGGILPAPLKAEPIGSLPEDVAGELKPFFLAPASMSHDYFYIAETSQQELDDLYTLPPFFKAVQPQVDDRVVDVLVTAETKRIADERSQWKESVERLKNWDDLEARGALTAEDRRQRTDELERRTTVAPNWLTWTQQTAMQDDAEASPAEQASQSRPRVLAAFDNNVPFLVQRNIGRGQVLLASSGMLSSWNTLPKTNTILLFDRIMRAMLWQTFPQRNFTSTEQFTVPVTDRNLSYQLTRPDGSIEPLSIDALGADQYGLTIRGMTSRGIYRVSAAKPDASADAQTARPWEITLATAGPRSESDPRVLDADTLRQRMPDANYRWVARDEAISLEGPQVSGQNLWKWLVALVIAALVLELGILARPMVGGERAV